MNIDILRTFLSVARTRNFTKYADENFCTQSTASLRIQSLEEYFGLKLFDRIGKTVYLTTAGELLLPCIKLVVETFDQTNEVVLDIKNLAVGKIALISSQTTWMSSMSSNFIWKNPLSCLWVDILYLF